MVVSVLVIISLVVSTSGYNFTEHAHFGVAECVRAEPPGPWEKNSSEEAIDCTAPWTYCANGTCKCGNISAHEDILQCHDHLNKNSTISHCYCVTFDETTGLTSAGNCVYTCGTGKRKYSDNIHHTLPNNRTHLDDFFCSPFNRTGTLCGRCQDGLYPLVYSLDMNCVECPNGKSKWWKYLLAAFLPLTIFFFIVLFFNINVISSHFLGFVWCIQGIAVPPLTRVILISIHKHHHAAIARWVIAMYGIWTLDFLRSFDLGICLGTDTLQSLALELAIGVYPLLLMLITYFLIRLYDRNFQPLVIIWKPFRTVLRLFRRNWDVRTSLIDAFATFFLLSNVKLLCVSYDLLVPVKVYQLNSTSPEPNHAWRLYYDANVPYFGERHLPFAVLSIIVLVFYMILPALLLMFYPFRWFHRFLNFFPFRWYILHTFMDNIYGCYKDGTQPDTRDCRWFAAYFFISRFIIMLVGGYTLNASYYSMTSIMITLSIVIMVNIQPFKDGAIDKRNTMFICLLALWHVGMVGLVQEDEFHPNVLHSPFEFVLQIIALIPHVYASVTVVYWMYQHKNFGTDLIRKLCAWHQGYQLLNS